MPSGCQNSAQALTDCGDRRTLASVRSEDDDKHFGRTRHDPLHKALGQMRFDDSGHRADDLGNRETQFGRHGLGRRTQKHLCTSGDVEGFHRSIKSAAVRPSVRLTHILHSWIILSHRILAAALQDDFLVISPACSAEARWIIR